MEVIPLMYEIWTGPFLILRMFMNSRGLHKGLNMVGQAPIWEFGDLLLFICGPLLCGRNNQHMTVVFWCLISNSQ